MEEEVFVMQELVAIVEETAELIDAQLLLTGEQHRQVRANLMRVARCLQSIEPKPATPVKGKRDF